MSTQAANGRARRPSLAEQIDRLDRILDGLAEGLAEAVAAAVEQAVGRAVEAALKEALTNARLGGVADTAPAPAGRGIAGTIRGALAAAVKGCRAGAAALAGRIRAVMGGPLAGLCQSARAVAGATRRVASGLARRAWRGGAAAALLARRFRRPLLVALAVGAAVGVGCYFAGPAVSSLVNGLAGFAGSLAVGALRRVRRALAGGAPRLGPAGPAQ